jgi:SAM-dependent methyltransferase
MPVTRPPYTALEAYEALAPTYDLFTADHDHERWLAELLRVCANHGLSGSRILDVACGTGKSFVPLLTRGFDVVACDLSPAMVARARQRHPQGEERVFVADMRALGLVEGPFDLVLCLDDAINYLTARNDLREAFAAVCEILAPSGLYVFDTNTLRTYGSAFTSTAVQEHDGVLFCWRGGSAEPTPGATFTATIDAFSDRGGLWSRSTSRHVQRHHPPATVLRELASAGLECVQLLGQRTGAVLRDDFDESDDTKLVYVARRAHPFDSDADEGR